MKKKQMKLTKLTKEQQKDYDERFGDDVLSNLETNLLFRTGRQDVLQYIAKRLPSNKKTK